MIDTANSTRCKNPKCGKPVHQTPGPHRPKEYCNDTCKEIAYRLRKKGITDGSVTVVDESAQQRIAELEHRVKELEARLDFEERFLTDTKVREFKIWLRSHPQPRGTAFFQRFLDDRDLPTKTSRSMYEAKLHHSKNYDEVDILLFRDAWKRMLFDQL